MKHVDIDIDIDIDFGPSLAKCLRVIFQTNTIAQHSHRKPIM